MPNSTLKYPRVQTPPAYEGTQLVPGVQVQRASRPELRRHPYRPEVVSSQQVYASDVEAGRQERQTAPNRVISSEYDEGTRFPHTERLPVLRSNLSAPVTEKISKWALKVGGILLIGVAAIEVLLLPACHYLYDRWMYGDQHLVQITAVVGHNDSLKHPSVFIATHTPQNNQVEVIEFPGGDLHHAKSYPLNLVSDAPASLTFEDAHHNGKPDLVIHVGESTIVLFNVHGEFSPTGK